MKHKEEIYAEKFEIKEEDNGQITPWLVSGNINYDKMAEKFGVSPVSIGIKDRLRAIAKSKGMELHPWIERDIFYAHRDIENFLDAYAEFLKPFESQLAAIHIYSLARASRQDTGIQMTRLSQHDLIGIQEYLTDKLDLPIEIFV